MHLSLVILHPSDDAKHVMVIFPILRAYDSPQFDTVGEALDFIREMLEGLAFLHEHRVVHRDIRSDNYMMDVTGMYSERFHFGMPNRTYDLSKPISLFQERHRTVHWPKYCIIDFEHSKRYPLDDMPPLELPVFASDNTAPELYLEDVPSNPFPIDVYRFGNLLRMDFIEGGNPIPVESPKRKGFEFLLPLIKVMMRDKPEDRVTMQEALEKFDEIVGTLRSSILRSRVSPRTRTPYERMFGPSSIRLTGSYWRRRLSYSLNGVSPMRPQISKSS